MNAADIITEKKLTPRGVWLLALAATMLNKLRPEGVLNEDELGDLGKVQDLLQTLISLAHVKEGKEHELGGNGQALADSLWLLEPLEKALQSSHAPESTNDHGSHFLELLSRKFAAVTEAAEHGKAVVQEDLIQIMDFFIDLANELQSFSIKSNEEAAAEEGLIQIRKLFVCPPNEL
ncbi:MAG: hypothetical protein V1885_02690 [Candidatus Brennerbacteria bacterium]